uniref:Uncharacterized protein n=1 Tax=Leersia perrieri TaxID=77586 RepID=A0A0D9W652_9ORYZ
MSLFRRRRTARVVDESALGVGGGGEDVGGAVARGGGGAGALVARALMAMSCVVRLDGEETGGGVEEAWATSGWRPPRAGDDEVSHIMLRESMRYAIYA